MWPWSKKSSNTLSIDEVIRRLELAYTTASGVAVTPENCDTSPTVKAVFTAIQRRFALLTPHVYKQTVIDGKTSKQLQTNHSVERLLSSPNPYQSTANYWSDAVVQYLRYGNYYAFIERGLAGPIRRLLPLQASSVEPVQDPETWEVTYKVTAKMSTGTSGQYRIVPFRLMHHVRDTSRDFLKGDSIPVDLREAIALEIAAERMGSSLFGNNAQPGLVFEYDTGSQGHKTDTERASFLRDIQDAYSGKGRFKAMLLPKGIKLGTNVAVDNDKAQFLELRQYQRTVIAGAFGVPPHLVGDLSKGTYNNVEQQGIEFNTHVILPIVSVFEKALERDLLTDNDRANGLIIRFNPNAVLRGDFKTQVDALAVLRQNGAVDPNEMREYLGMNPREEPEADMLFVTGPSGQTSTPPQDAPAEDVEDTPPQDGGEPT